MASSNEPNIGRIVFFGVIIFVALVLLVTVLSSVYTINAGESGVLLTFGKVSQTSLSPGLHFKWPLVQSVVTFDTRSQKYTTDSSAASQDLQIVSVSIATNYHIDSNKVGEIYQNLGVNFQDTVIQPAEQEVVKATTATFTAEELITKRPQVALEIENALRERLAPRNILVEAISVTNFDFSDSFDNAIEQKVVAQQNKLKAENDLARIEVEARQVAAQAEGEKQASIARAEGEAAAIRLVQEQLKVSQNYISWYALQRWDGKLPFMMGTGATPLVDVSSITNGATK